LLLFVIIFLCWIESLFLAFLWDKNAQVSVKKAVLTTKSFFCWQNWGISKRYLMSLMLCCLLIFQFIQIKSYLRHLLMHLWRSNLHWKAYQTPEIMDITMRNILKRSLTSTLTRFKKIYLKLDCKVVLLNIEDGSETETLIHIPNYQTDHEPTCEGMKIYKRLLKE